MSAKLDQKTINKCMLQILNNYAECNCRVLCIKPFCKPSGFSITSTGRFPYKVLERVSILENEEKRTFIFQIENDSKIYADDVIPKVTLNYLYVGEIADNPMKNKVLYECDRRACHDKCNLECHHTTDVTHAKNFEYKDGTWVEV